MGASDNCRAGGLSGNIYGGKWGDGLSGKAGTPSALAEDHKAATKQIPKGGTAKEKIIPGGRPKAPKRRDVEEAPGDDPRVIGATPKGRPSTTPKD